MRKSHKRGSQSSSLARRGPSRTVIVQRGASMARRAGSAVAQAARDEQHTLYAVGAAGALGYAQREGMLDSIPHIDALGVEGTLGAVAWAIGKYSKSKTAAHVATGLLCVAINKMASGS